MSPRTIEIEGDLLDRYRDARNTRRTKLDALNTTKTESAQIAYLDAARAEERAALMLADNIVERGA